MMKKFVLCSVLIGSIIPANAEQLTATVVPPIRTISTQGEAQINVVPDRATVLLVVSTRDRDVERAYAVNAETAGRVVKLAEKFHIDGRDVQTSNLNLERGYRDSKLFSGDSGYEADTQIQFVLHDPKLAPDLIKSALAAGANRISSVTLESTESRKHRDEARILALRAAREKAEALAAELKVRIVKPVRVEEVGRAGIPSYGARGYVNMNTIQDTAAGELDTGSSLALGTIPINSHIHATFEFE
jgi:uncharacterized protein